MNLSFSPEQELLRDTARRLVADTYSLAQRTAYMRDSEGFSRANWRRLAELGLLGLPFAEHYGGTAAGGVEMMIVMEAFGRGLVVEPYLATVVLGGGLIRELASDSQCQMLLPPLIEGRLLLAFAHGEPKSRYSRSYVETTARRDGDVWILDGRKSVVLHGDSADFLIVSARTAGAATDEEGITLFLVGRETNGLSIRGYPTNDGQRAAEVTLDGVRITPEAMLGERDQAFAAIDKVIDQAMAALCAEAAGSMTALYEMTVEYLNTRRQFGAPLASFQALQHRAVDMLMACEQATSAAYLAALAWSEDDAASRRRIMAAAKVTIGRSGRFVGQQAIQLHGGIGMTDEYAAGHYFKRLTMIDVLFGDADHHLGRYAERLADASAAMAEA